MKTISIVLLTTGIVGTILMFLLSMNADNKYNQEIYNYWSLADKSSTIEAKSEYIDKFVSAIDNAKLSGNNALIYKNPDNSFEYNFKAVQTLQKRLSEIKTMNPNSFEYQQAILQITQQEQGEAEKMLNVIKGVWVLDNYIYLWSYIALSILVFLIAMSSIGLWMYLEAQEEE
jgi:hypothetical protein